MLSEDFDKRIREAAEHHHPAYDEKAWKGMKQLLDKHMPEKEEKKRRFLFFILLFLLLGGGVWMATGGLNTRGKKQTSVTTQPKEPISKPPSAVDVNNNKGSVPVKSGNDKKEIATYKNDDKEKDETAVNIKPDNKTFNPQLNFQNPNKKEKKSGSGLNKKIKEKVSPAEKDITGKQGNPADEPHIKVKSEPVVIASGKGPGDDKTVENPETAGNKKPFASAAPKDATENKTLSENKQPVNGNIPGNEENNSRETVTRKPKQGSAKKNSFFFSTSLMPDVSFTGGDPLGKMKLLRGAGIGYTIRDKFTMRTGFY